MEKQSLEGDSRVDKTINSWHDLNKYVKIVILSTLEEPKSLSDISMTWFNNRARLYYPPTKKEIEKAVKDGLLTKNKKLYGPNMPRLLNLLLEEMNFGEEELAEGYKLDLKVFYLAHEEYIRKTYFNFEVIKQFTKLDYRKANELSVKLLLQLPILLRVLEEKDEDTANMVIQTMDLEEYVMLIQKLEIQNYYILQERKLTLGFADELEWLSDTIGQMKKKELSNFWKNIKAMKALED